MSTAKKISVVEIVAFGWLFLSNWAVWFIGLCVVVGILSDYVPHLRGSPAALWLTFVPAFCLALGWGGYRVRNRTIRKNTVYFIGMFLRVWLLWLITFLATIIFGAETFRSANTWTPWATTVTGWSCTFAALCVSIGWVIYSVRKEYLAETEYHPREFLNLIKIIFRSARSSTG